MNNNVIDINDVTCLIDGDRILDSVSLAVSKGERVSILGPNGAGKSTLLRCVMRILPVSSGSISIYGTDTLRMRRKQLAARIGYVPQRHAGSCPFTVGEYVLLGRYPHLSPFSFAGDRDREVAMKALERTGMIDFSERSFDTLSGGERQMVQIAAVMAQGAEVLLLDEPSVYLDPGHRSGLMKLLAALNSEEGMAIVTVTHDINEAILSGGKMAMIREGKIIFTGDPELAISSGKLEELFEKEFVYCEHPVTGDAMVLPDGRWENE
ncbi:MAG: ABC transporter ATP-binding protein [Candidatus Krumholzibacteria bacterium]|nr:ABC transporter ATP-binding protein [Candidatus Krumholzibacteria bacterium]